MAGQGRGEGSSPEGFWNVPFKKARPSCGLGEAASGGGKGAHRNQAGAGDGVAPCVLGRGGVLAGEMRVQQQPSWKVTVGWEGRRGPGPAGRQVAVVLCVCAGAVGGSEGGGAPSPPGPS